MRKKTPRKSKAKKRKSQMRNRTGFYKIFKHISSSLRVTKWSKPIVSLRFERLRVRFPLNPRSSSKYIHMKSSMAFTRILGLVHKDKYTNVISKNYGGSLYECVIAGSWRSIHDSWVALSCCC